MAREFTRNLLIMGVSIMVGIVVITFFLADVVYQSQIQQLNSEHVSEIENIEENNIFFTSSFLESSVLLDSAREDRAFGNYHFDLAHLFFTSALSERNETKMDAYRLDCEKNCSKALPKYELSSQNFKLASSFFESTKQYTNFESYDTLLSMYVNLTNSGAKLTLLRYNATIYLKMIAENITFVNNSAVPLMDNLSDIMDLFNQTMIEYGGELGNYEEIQDEIDEYNIEGFSPIREQVP